MELDAARNNSLDASKVMSERMALARESSNLKLEVEHLKSQVKSHQAVFAEKLAIQHQLDAARLELELERRANQRAKARDQERLESDKKLQVKIEDVQAELALEQQRRAEADKDARVTKSNLETQSADFDTRVSSMKSKLRASQEQLRSLRGRQLSKGGPRTHDDALPVPRSERGEPNGNLEQHAAIGTPGDVPAAKRLKPGSTTFGDKAAFSIPPFLNRTSGPAIRPAAHTRSNSPPFLEQTVASAFHGSQQLSQGGDMDAAEFEASISSRHRLSPAVSPVRAVEAPSNLLMPSSLVTKPTVLLTSILNQSVEGRQRSSEPGKRKRKILRAQVPLAALAEEDAEVPNGSSARPSQNGSPGTSKPTAMAKRTGLSKKPIAQTVFSPLKRDRRAVPV